MNKHQFLPGTLVRMLRYTCWVKTRVTAVVVVVVSTITFKPLMVMGTCDKQKFSSQLKFAMQWKNSILQEEADDGVTIQRIYLCHYLLMHSIKCSARRCILYVVISLCQSYGYFPVRALSCIASVHPKHKQNMS